ncbi:MAG TPA: response regulator [Candidatus Binataceae bacterium]|nr:response regulator [Candidatus Binataceae bacterium]
MPQISQAIGERIRDGGRKQAVLVVDDDPIHRTLIVRYLQRLGFAVDEAANGREAVEAVMRAGYAAVLMDCEMPEMDGYQATIEIRRAEGAARHTRIVALTANGNGSDRARCLAAGMDETLSKPVRPETLAQMLASSDDVNSPTKAVGESLPLGGADPVLDPELISDLREAGQDLLDHLIESFVQNAPTRIAQMADEFAGSNLKAASISAHNLKGSAGNLGAKRMAGICATLDLMARNGSIENVAVLIVDLRAEYGRVKEALHAEHSAQTEATEA